MTPQGTNDRTTGPQTPKTPLSGMESTSPAQAGARTKPSKGWPPMVGWYDPSQLLSTGLQVVLSTIFGRHADHRLIEALSSTVEALSAEADEVDHSSRDDETRRSKNLPYHSYVNDEHDKPRAEMWIDYVADVGDGWNSTYAVAYHLVQPGLTFKDSKGKEHPTKRGDILVFGGDEVYPTPGRTEYERRLVVPYNMALRCTTFPHPQVFAIPGNHDWYDSLVSYTRLFCSKKWFAGWQAPQDRSYFALQLPHGWWLLGTDVQLGSDIDKSQVDFFEKVGHYIQEGDRIILCNAEPAWIRAKTYGKYNPDYSERALLYLQEKVLGKEKKISVFIAGDLHHYRRHEAEDRTQKITAGGGGAFLHPTHTGWLPRKLDSWLSPKSGPDVRKIEEEPLPTEGGGGAFLPPTRTGWLSRKLDSWRSRTFGADVRETVKEILSSSKDVPPPRTFTLKQCFPDEKISRRLCRRNLLFPYLNPTFGLMTGLLYMLSVWSVMTHIELFTSYGLHDLGQVVCKTLTAALGSPVATFWGLVLLLGFVLFTDTHSRLYRWIAGSIHGVVHVIAAFFVGWGAIYFTVAMVGLDFKGIGQLLLSGVLIFGAGWIIGSCILGLYLLVSLNVFGRHSNEAFSSLKVPDWKNFLRLKIDADGNLTIFAIGIRRVPRKWKRSSAGVRGPDLIPCDPNATGPELIEDPIPVKHPARLTTNGSATSQGEV